MNLIDPHRTAAYRARKIRRAGNKFHAAARRVAKQKAHFEKTTKRAAK